MLYKFFLVAASFIYTAGFAQLNVSHLQVENQVNPMGVDIPHPRFSWQLNSPKRNIMQVAYEIKVSAADGKGSSWNSGKVASGQSVHVEYAGPQLKEANKYYWQVRVWASNGQAAAWSAPAQWQMGILSPAGWKAKWIEAGYAEDSINRPSPQFRKQFAVAKKIKSATAFITSHGLYEAFLNGRRIGDTWLTPGWTSYNKRLQYQVYDVTQYLQSDKNTVGVALGSGWYRGTLAWNGNKNSYGRALALLFQLQITYTDGSTENVLSDESWRSAVGAIQSSEIYNGEVIDARQEKSGWMINNYDDSKWAGVITKTFDNSILTSTVNEAVKKHETFKALQIITTPKGERVIDFGQNLVGFVMVKIKGNAGDKIIIQHAEVLDKAGNFYTENLRSAKQENTYILKGGGEEYFEPHFTFQGFRYIKITGFTGTIKPEDFTAVALYSDMPETGNFTCSNPLLNQLQHNIQWGQKGNFLDVPTDCPQRDERLGWTGDAQVFSRTAAYNMQVENFFGKWLKDIAADQLPNGSVPYVVPNVLGAGAAGSAGWADAATIIPWNMYLCYGDKKILEQQYASMKAWVGYMQQQSRNDLWNTGFHFGDWLFYRPNDDNDGKSAITDKYLIAQCFYAQSTQLVINAAKVLGNNQDVDKYIILLDKIKAAFLKEYVTPTGRLVSASQTAYVLALQFDMLPESLRAQAAERLVQNIKDYNNHLTTGFLGTPHLCHVLTRFGYTGMAYTLLLQETYPSWLYPVKMGATTIWERWDGQKPDSSFQTPGMNSFNHYSYGAIGDWMYRVIAGIDTYDDAPGYKHIKIMPHLGGNLSYANADLQTGYGMVRSHWKLEKSSLILDVEVPANTTATLYIPATENEIIKEGGQLLGQDKNMMISQTLNDYKVIDISSGIYHFTVDKK
ncbi:MAG: family 78 glycoside hydrolase catalytic domain [Aquabacterium sp.]|nr:family 78 glycoside hydrolase catalytic domain [Ferruginibacter sp.]